MAGLYFKVWKLRRSRLAAAMLIVCVTVLGAGYARVQAPSGEGLPPLAGFRITVDPGHGGIDPGCHRGDTFEKEIVLRIGSILADRLRALGADVSITRESDIELSHLTDSERTRHRRDLAARVLLAREHAADLLVSLHVNSAASSSMGGAMVFHHPGSLEGKRIGEHVLRELRAVVPGNQNSVLSADYYILRHAPMTAVLIETGFITNPADRALLESDDGRLKIAEAIARGLEAALSAKPGTPPGSENPPVSAPSSLFAAESADNHSCVGEDE